MFGWLAKKRRRKILEAPFPFEWEAIIRKNMAHYKLLDEDEQRRLRERIAVFMAEKNWEGCGGLELTDEIRVTVSAMACLLILNLPRQDYENVESILVYPSERILPEQKIGFFETALAPLETPGPISGQAFEQGPILLVWDAVHESIRYAGYGYNVVYHEFAHKLDMQDGVADGTPRLRDRAEYRDWVKTCSREYKKLLKNVERGKRTFLDEYGAKDEAEFFAVATEHFFDQPLGMKRAVPELYRVLKNFYRQDPAARESQYAAAREEQTRKTEAAFAKATDEKKGDRE
ncbi:MAG TPA: zinc-dependent peptidase [Smithellaceae bacterium]|nr:zinc-dependent peptidase [Smithellaceae bacterium]HQH04259.1 zinc-dependent peptidase [Smithellaceae bacterium]HQJ77206.1 zinc-dependent peptidase [Smithellaceae bacterium]